MLLALSVNERQERCLKWGWGKGPPNQPAVWHAGLQTLHKTRIEKGCLAGWYIAGGEDFDPSPRPLTSFPLETLHAGGQQLCQKLQ